MPKTVTKDQIISATYVALFQRAPDQAGLTFWQASATGKTGEALTVAMANDFAKHPAFTTIYGGLGQAAFIDEIYKNIGGKVADAAGRKFWLDQLESTTSPISRADLVGKFIHMVLTISPEDLAAQAAEGTITAAELTDALARQDRLTNKADVGLEFTKAMGVGSNLNLTDAQASDLAVLNKTPSFVASKAIIAGVTEDDATMAAPKAFLAATPTTNEIITKFGDGSSVGAGGETFTLTTGADNLVGTAGNDTFRGDNTTLQATDTVKGGAGTDTFEYTDARTTAVAGDKVPAALVSEVEVINIRNVNGTAAVAPTAEKATVTFADVTVVSPIVTTAPTSTIVIGGRTVTLTGNAGDGTTKGADVTFTAAQIASAFATSATAGLPVGVSASGTVGAYAVTSAGGSQVVFTSTGTGDVPNLTITGTGASAQSIAIVDGTNGATSTGANIEVMASNFVGATDFNSNLSTNGVTFTGLATGQKVGVIGNGSIATGALSFAYATPTDAVTVNVAGGTKVGSTITNTGAGATAVTVNSTGAANTVGAVQLAAGATVKTLTINAATNLTTAAVTNLATDAAVTVSGAAASVTLGTTALTNAKTIDASGLTVGGVTVALDTVVTSFKGGQGNDVVTTNALAATASVDAGAGTADVLVVRATGGDTDTAAEGALYKGFEVLRTADDQNMAHFTNSTITGIQMNAASSKTLSNVTAAQAGNITVRGDQTTAFTVTLADATGTADVVGLTLSAPTATATVPVGVDVAGLSIKGVETLNITSSGGGVDLANAGTLNSLTFAAGGPPTGADKLKTVTVAGTSSLDLNLANTAMAVTVTSAQTGTGSLKVAGNVIKGSSITTTANKDNITVTAQADGAAGDFITYDAGAGDDAISATAAAINNSVNTKASVKIDGGAGIDTLTFSETNLTLGDAQFQYITNIEKFENSTAGTVAIATGGFFDTNYKAAGAEFTLGETAAGAARSLDASSFTGNLKVTVSNFGIANASTVKTGAGNDTITLTQGTTINTTTHVIEAGLGNDTIIAKNALVTITGGKGADTIDITDVTNDSDTIVIGAGDSTAAARDKVTGFQAVAATGDKLDLAGPFSLQAAVAAADGTDSGLIKSHSITAGGIITFDDINAYDTALTINATNLADALAYATANFTTAGKTVGFAYDSDNNGTADATIVFQAGATAADATVVELVGLTGVTTLAASAAASTIVII